MRLGDRNLDTICALSTASGHGGIAVIRVSGGKALESARNLARFLPEMPHSHQIYFGTLKTRDEEDLDEVLISYFAKGMSFTGEETLEISCHGSPQISGRILRELCASGCRAAERGEFTFRAFMNGNMDLIQAESILSLVQSEAPLQAAQALKQLKGGLSEKILKIEEQLIWCLAHLEANIDFSQEGLQSASSEMLLLQLASLESELADLVSSYKQGRILRDGLTVTLVGAVNVGKSSLLNLILGEKRALVSEIPGTTRDLVDGELFISGVKVRFVDTAGVRESQDPVEKLGIERSRSALADSDLVFFIFDLSLGLSENEKKMVAGITQSCLVIGNKSDQAQIRDGINVCAFHPEDRNILLGLVEKHIDAFKIEDQSVLLNSRHFELLNASHHLLKQACLEMREGVSEDLICLSLREALERLQEVLGKRYDDEILERVFKEFCIGK